MNYIRNCNSRTISGSVNISATSLKIFKGFVVKWPEAHETADTTGNFYTFLKKKKMKNSGILKNLNKTFIKFFLFVHFNEAY